MGEWIAERVPNFKTFDFFDEATGLATSAKTLDTRALGYVREPRRVFLVLKRYIDGIDRFQFHTVGDLIILSSTIEHRSFKLAVPVASKPEQIKALNRARAYAESLAIEMEVTLIR